MPTYEYQCEKCGHTFDQFQSITAEPLKNCTKEGCDGTVKRLFSAGAGFIFKGSGFYTTDYRSDSYKKAASGDSGSTSSTSSAPAPSAPASGTSTASTSSSTTSSASSSSTAASTPGK